MIKAPEIIVPFLNKPNMMVLSTLKKDGNIQMSVVWYQYKEGQFWISTNTERAKYFNIKRNPHISFLIPNTENIYQYVQVSGKAEITKEGALELIDHLSEYYRGQTPYPEDPDQRKRRIVLVITPTKYITQGFH